MCAFQGLSVLLHNVIFQYTAPSIRHTPANAVDVMYEFAFVYTTQSNLLKTNFSGPTQFVLIVISSSYQDIVIHVQYYSKPNRAWKRVCVK